MKAVTLIIELKRDRQLCEDEIAFLASKLPAYSEKAMHGTRLVGFVMPARDILPAMHAPLQRALSVFQNYWFIGVSGEVLCKNGSFDPLASAIKQYIVQPVGRRDRYSRAPANDDQSRKPRGAA